MNVPEWSLFKYPPAQASNPGNQGKANDDAIHNSSKHASRELNEPAARPSVASSRCVSNGSLEREPMDGSVGGGRYISCGNSQSRLMILDSTLTASLRLTESSIIVDDDDDSDPTDRSNHTLH
jgi:hypothetical protein